MQLNMSSSGNILPNHRRAEDKVVARNMVGKPFHILVRDNGLDYEVNLNRKLKGRWIPYALKELSDDDRAELGKVALFAEEYSWG